MFKVEDTFEHRKQMLIDLYNIDKCVGFLIAIANFEWTIRRAILALGQLPTKDIKESVFRQKSKNNSNGDYFVCGLDGYKQSWKDQVSKQIPLVTFLEQTIKISNILGYDTNLAKPGCGMSHMLKEAFRFRAQLVHGISGTARNEKVEFMFNFIIKCSEAITLLCNEYKSPIFGKKIVRRSHRKELIQSFKTNPKIKENILAAIRQ